MGQKILFWCPFWKRWFRQCNHCEKICIIIRLFWMMFACGKWWRLRLMMFASRMMRGFATFYGKHRIIAKRSGATSYLRSKCIISPQVMLHCYSWTDSNRHTPSEAFQKTFPFKNYLQSHRCNGILGRFELPHYSACRNHGESENDAFSVRIDSNYHIDSKAMQNGNTK